MKANWPEVIVKDVCDLVVDCVNKTAPVLDYSSPYKMIRTTNVRYGVVNLENARSVSKETYEKWTRRSVPKFGDIILTREAPLGEVGMLKSNEKVFLGQRTMQYRANPEKLDSHFLLYALQESFMQGQIRASGSGSTVEHMRVGDAENLKIKLPHMDVQQKIGANLSAYDDLIENNNRRIAILEEMARSLYREWFVKFRFPGHEEVKMVDSELGQIPEGWEIKKTADLLKRLTVKAKYTQENIESTGIIPVIDQSRDEILGFHNNQADVMANNDFPIAIFGDHTCKMQLLVEAFSIGPNVIPFTSKINRPMQYIFYLVNSLVTTKEYKRHWTELISKEVVLAPQNITERFSNLIKPLLAQINLLKKKNHNLKTQRDMLLPKLISGKIKAI